MKPAGFVLATLVGVAFSASPIYAAVPAKFSFPMARAPHPLPLDPSLSDPAWAAGAVPNGEGPWVNVTTRSPAQHETTAYVLYDDKNLYVGFKAAQAGTPITATQSTNDSGFGIDDFVGIGIDTSGAGSQTYYFEATPRGVRYEQANENVRFRPRWQAAAKVSGGNWNAVMVIPLSVLKIGGSQTWHIQFVRAVAARGEHYAWGFNGIMQDAPAGTWPTFNDTRFWPSATGIKLAGGGKPKPRADIYGLASIGEDRDLFQQANQTFLPMQVRNYGVDVSIPLTRTISFVGTANPDFSNVEIDQQTIVPQEFQRQLIEYRPFFAQGANFINASSGSRTPSGGITTAPNLIFYSPDIGPFDWGAKTEGTFGKQSFGALAFRGFDQTTGNTFADEAYGYEHALPDGTFYYWSDGVLAHHSISGNDSTMEVGAQGRNYHNGLVWFVDHAFENGSWVPQGHADFSQVSADIHKPNWEIFTSYMDTAPNYNPIDGYTPISDVRGPMAFLQFNGSTPGIKNWSLFTAVDRFIDQTGAVHQADTQVFLNTTFKNNFSIDGAGVAVGQLRQYGIPQGPGCSGPISYESTFTGYPCYRDGETLPYNLYSIPIGYGDGTPSPIDVNYSWGPFGGNYVHLFTASTARPVARIVTLGLAYDGTYERSLTTGVLDSQWLRSVSVAVNLSDESTFTVALRDINGYGGFATQIGNNLAVAFHERFRGGNELYVNYGSPAAGATINRLIVKYVFHAGADAGT
ncbi:MAG TPA: hypothetical protein VKB39_06215 [Candidatus Baltobacteraceae bacterium]|nr:hypothetical protein [Candidatus Baltobacteraceae bacterium]